MKQVNFSNSGGFPLEQETLERLQTAYRSELFAALQSHLSIEPGKNYIIAHATTQTIGWAVIHREGETEQILYPIAKGIKTNYLKTTRTGTNLVYGDGTSQTAYFDFEAVYIDQTAFNSGISKSSDAETIDFYNLTTFKVIQDSQTIENILKSIEANIDAVEGNINQIEGNINLIENNIDEVEENINTIETNIVDIKKNYLLIKGSQLDTSTEDFESSDSSNNSLLLIDNVNQVIKSNNLLNSLLGRIAKLEKGTAVPIGMIAIWGRPASEIPAGWEEYVPLRGRMPVGLNPVDPDFSRLNDFAGSKTKKLEISEMPSHNHSFSRINSDSNGNGDQYVTTGEGDEARGTAGMENTGGGLPFSIMNPYRVIYFIEYTGRLKDTKPTNLTASNISFTTLTLTWTASSDSTGVSNYILYKDGIELVTLGGGILSYPVTGLTPGAIYTFSVVARNTAGNLSAASYVTATTVKDLMAPSKPTGLRTYPTAENHITLEWNPSTDNVGVVRYIVSRRYPNGTSDIIGTPNNYLTVLGAQNTTYYFSVQALDAAGNASPFSGEVAGAADPSVGDPGDEDPGNSCFDVESLVTMASGQSKKLKNIIVGDKLQGFSFPNEIDESEGDYMIWTGKLQEAAKAEVTVVNKVTSVQPDYYEIKTADTTLKVTGQHPLLITEDGENIKWVCVKNVLQSMLLIDKTGKTKAIESIVFKEEPLEVALLDVESVDNYVISGIVAHNSKPLDPKVEP